MSYRPEETPVNVAVNGQVGASRKLFRKPVSPDVQKLIESAIENGFVIIENAFQHAEVDEAIGELERLKKLPGGGGGPASGGGRNSFEGFQTHRMYALLNKSRVFDKFVMHPMVVALNDFFLDPGWLLNAYQAINIQPGENPQTLHHDDGYVTLPRPHRPFGTAIMVALDDYTETNGATVVVPKSHTWTDRLPKRSEAVPVIMPKGSVVYFLGTLWHGGGQNISDKERRALTVQYCQPWMRPLENQFLAVDFDKLPNIPKQVVDMMGYQVGAPFIGYVNGNSPRKAAERYMEQQVENRGSKI